MTNTPIKMIFQEGDTQPKTEVLVYDFFHDTESFASFALCWVPHNESWLTAPIVYLSPIKQKKSLNETTREVPNE